IYAVLQGVLAGNPAVAGIGSQSEYVTFRALKKWHIAHAVCNGLVPAFPSIPIVVYPLAHGLPHIEERGFPRSFEQDAQLQVFVAEFAPKTIHRQGVVAMGQRNLIEVIDHAVSVYIL